MNKRKKLDKLQLIDADRGWSQRKDLLSNVIQNYFKQNPEVVDVLEAGCGKRWPIKMGDIKYTLTGVDIDAQQLDMRQTAEGDLDKAICGDLRTTNMNGKRFDLIYCCDVIEHINGAEKVIDNFFNWLNPNGLLVLVFPDRNSCEGFITRILPHWSHLIVYKYIMRYKFAGKPGYGPFPTHFDKIVSRHGIHNYCSQNGHPIIFECGRPPSLTRLGAIWHFLKPLMWFMQLLSSYRLKASHSGLAYAIRKVAHE